MTDTPTFDIDWPGEALFGPGRCDELGELIRKRGQRHALLITDPGIEASGILHRIETALARSGIKYWAFTGVESHPTTHCVHFAHGMWNAANFDVLIALGGGSAIDTAKGVMAQVITGRTAEETYYLDIDSGRGPTPPFVALPTTAGTGSESSLAAVLKSPERKFVIRGRRLRPILSIMDPELTLTLPRALTAMSGFEAFCQALGAFANDRVHPVVDELALQSMRLLLDWLPLAIEDGLNIDARTSVMQSSWLAGLCIGQVGVDGAHGLATPVESKVKAVHGEVLGAILPHMLSYNAETLAQRYALAARRLGLAPASMDETGAAQSLIDASIALRRVTGGRTRLSDLGISIDMIGDLKRMALLSQAVGRNGRPLDGPAIERLYEAMI